MVSLLSFAFAVPKGVEGTPPSLWNAPPSLPLLYQAKFDIFVSWITDPNLNWVNNCCFHIPYLVGYYFSQVAMMILQYLALSFIVTLYCLQMVVCVHL